VTALQPFDTHPADPGTLSSYGESLASQVSLAVSSLDPGTQHAYAPVVASWGGVGQAEAHHSAPTGQ
jgi:hypothetical protein